MAVCASCGQENPDIARFCLACGLPLEDADGAPREERRLVSVIFVDMVGFTSMAEHLDPEEVQALLRPYHETVRREIESFGGIVEKFIGDAIVGVFGAPTAYGDDAERAVRAALTVRDTVAAMEAADARLDLKVRIAVNTGEALVIVNARPALGEAMVTGDVVNTAARLQAAAPVGGVLAGEETYRATRDAILYAPTPPVDAKGKERPVPAWVALRSQLRPGERPAAGPLVGRSHELDVLRGTWERVADERMPHLVTVIGPAGVGKSRLAGEFASMVRDRGGRTVRGRVLPYRESTAYSALAFQLKQLCGIYETDSVEAARTKLAEAVRSLLAPDDAPAVTRHLEILLGLDPESTVSDREALFLSIRSFIEAIAARQPTMLVFEDIQWADEALLELVGLLVARLGELPVLVLVLARPELLELRPDWGAGLLAHTALRLRPLDAQAAADLAAHRLADAGAGKSLERAADLAATADGNPLFIEQLVAALAESDDREAPLPTTIRELIAARLDALPAQERTVLLDAAVAGRVFWRGAVERMAADPDGLADSLAALERRELITRQKTSAFEGEEQFAFNHVLVRDVAYELLPRAVRRDRHREAAMFFEEASGEFGEAGAAIARHWRDAGNPVRSFDYFIAAAEMAEHGWAKERAAALYREALQLVPDGDDDRRREVTRRLGLAEAASYHVFDARAVRAREPQGG
ncbi:MAG TPA: AAA family ATPase [Gaiellaceae bacterium]|jgi:class 3 adenylate cyclase